MVSVKKNFSEKFHLRTPRGRRIETQVVVKTPPYEKNYTQLQFPSKFETTESFKVKEKGGKVRGGLEDFGERTSYIRLD